MRWMGWPAMWVRTCRREGSGEGKALRLGQIIHRCDVERSGFRCELLQLHIGNIPKDS